jgi:hypothetical protein
MAYDIFSTHIPTGSSTTVVSTNPYSAQGRNIGYPTTFDKFVRVISEVDGSQTVIESRKVSDLVGSRLYLYHRPLINSNGSVATITSSDGTIDSSFTNSAQGYIVFSSLPSSDFTVTYVAVPDCDLSWSVNTLQDSVMELQNVIGPTNSATYPSIRNMQVAVLDSPADAVTSGVFPNAYYLSHLNQNIVIASTDDAGLAIARGTAHTIQLGRETDNVIIDATGFTILQTDGTLSTTIRLGTETGDSIYWKGAASGAGPLTIGGPEWPGYSGVVFSTGLTGSFYSGAMLRVHGDAAFMGNIKAIGNITVVNTTGSTSTVLGDWTVQDELFVNGISHLNGTVEANNIEIAQNIYLSRNLIAENVAGAGGGGQTLIDNLDCSEIAHNYSYVTKSKHNNTVISAPLKTNRVAPKKVTYRPWLSLGPSSLVGDIFAITGTLNAAASSSGVHPHILQLLMSEGIVSGTYTGSLGTTSGVWSAGMMDPGAMWVRMLNGPAQNFESPIYSFTVEQTSASNLTRLNVFLPDAISNPPQTNNSYILFNPKSCEFNTVSAVGGGSPTFSINASATEPLAVSFEDEVRIMTSSSTNYSLTNALEYSVSGLGGSPVTGIAYIFADSNGTDPENPPIFRAKPVPIRLPGQTPVGEVVASKAASTWTILETVSYRPNGIYDSSWVPIHSSTTITATSGRVTPGFSSSTTSPLRVYFHHYLGSDVEIGNISADLYLGRRNSNSINWNQTHTPMYSFFGQDGRNNHGLNGVLMHVPLGAKRTSSHITERDASIFYLDSAIIGVDISPGLLAGFPTGASSSTSSPNYLRLIVNKNN